MIANDFNGIKYFTKKEVQRTGAKLKDVKFQLIYTIDLFRAASKRKVKLLKNGITSGNHKSKWHPNGKAIDCYYDPSEGVVDIKKVLALALKVGFKGIGIYWNASGIYSFHFDLRSTYSFWIGTKKSPKAKSWKYGILIVDPKNIT